MIILIFCIRFFRSIKWFLWNSLITFRENCKQIWRNLTKYFLKNRLRFLMQQIPTDLFELSSPTITLCDDNVTINYCICVRAPVFIITDFFFITRFFSKNFYAKFSFNVEIDDCVMYVKPMRSHLTIVIGVVLEYQCVFYHV